MKLIYKEITEAIIGAAFEVYNELGYGFLEKVYQQAMQVELLKRGHSAEHEHPIKVKFKGVIVGDYAADLLVDEKVIVELKVAEKYNANDEPQLLNQLKATEMRLGMLINFGKQRVTYKRSVAQDFLFFSHGYTRMKHGLSK
jgi:GxxExxY protein